jgi:hypothetical protein
MQWVGGETKTSQKEMVFGKREKIKLNEYSKAGRENRNRENCLSIYLISETFITDINSDRD